MTGPGASGWWVWEAYDSRGQLRMRRRLRGWWATRPSQQAAERMALLIHAAATRGSRDVLRGWRVVAWPEGRPDLAAVELADDWLRIADRRARRRPSTRVGRRAPAGRVCQARAA